jgi:hypothetical protein
LRRNLHRNPWVDESLTVIDNPGAAYFDRRNCVRLSRRLTRRPENLGHRVSISRSSPAQITGGYP